MFLTNSILENLQIAGYIFTDVKIEQFLIMIKLT